MKYDSKIKDGMTDQFFKAILSLQSLEECYRFFEDICTINEVKSIVQRLEVAKMLRDKRTYNDIAKETHASTATISRVNRALNYGSNGYNIILDRLYPDD